MSNVLSPLPSAGMAGSAPRSEAEVTETLRDGTKVRIRPLQRDDAELERRFIEDLSARSRRFRFLDSMSSPSSTLLRNLIEIDPATDAAYVALVFEGGRQREIGVARFSAAAHDTDCEFAVTVTDDWQRRGLGTLLMQRLVALARARGMTTMHSLDFADNDPMRGFAKHLGFESKRDPDDAAQVLYHVELASLAPSAVGA